MREMKNSGIEWIGDIPSEWNVIKLCYVTDDIFLGKTPIYSEEHNENYTLGQKNNQLYGIDFNGIKFSTDEHFNACKESEFLKYGDILLNSLGTGSVGRIGFFDSNKRMLTDGHIIVIRPNNKINSKYLFYYLRTLRKKFEDDAVGSTNQAFLTVPKIYKILVPFPDIYMQKEIADFLDEKCAEIDTVIEKTKATIEEYKKLKQSVITQAVTKGIRPNRPMKDSGIEWIGEIPEDWNIVPHKVVMHKKKDICEHYNGEDIISLTMSGVIVRNLTAGGKMPSSFDGYQFVEKEDLLLCLFDIDVTPRCVGVVKNNGITSPAYSRFKMHKGFYNCYYDYLLRAIDNDKVFVHLSKNLRSSLTESDFGVIKTIAPSFEEQKIISVFLDNKCSEIDELIAKKTTLLSELENYKKSLIYEYVTGKKEVK